MTKINKFVLFALIIMAILTSCENSSKDTQYIYVDQNKIDLWNGYIQDLGVDSVKKRTIILFSRSADCRKYENEIRWWDSNISNLHDTDVVLIILEKYTNYFKSVKNVLNVQIPTYQDEYFTAIENNMIPFAPSKIFIDYEKKRIVMGKMGTIQSIKNFLDIAYAS